MHTISEDPVAEEAAAEFQAALNEMADGAGMAATVMTADGNGAERRARRTAFETFGSTTSSHSSAA